ncbi:RNA-binding protein [Ruegeria marisrubri]|uniref:RNA-binding protein n=1 Tax=Ruegeria marisrubri TaxID=1685379 RepID=A0A0X3TQ53_9RHOB|nr:DciA family protein [Ruegeria marisrubri]KUJ77892.1 RNA-binding protein [Ruegeria marisrubri]
MPSRQSTTRGFKRTATLLNDQIRRAGESRGFAVSRVLTHWAEIVGQDIAAIARPVKVGYGKDGFGATLTVLTTGPQAPMLEMQREQLRARVNAAYGYNAISRIRITQTAPTGFAEGQAQFTHKAEPAKTAPAPEIVAEASKAASEVHDGDLRAALERLGRNVLSKKKR